MNYMLKNFTACVWLISAKSTEKVEQTSKTQNERTMRQQADAASSELSSAGCCCCCFLWLLPFQLEEIQIKQTQEFDPHTVHKNSLNLWCGCLKGPRFLTPSSKIFCLSSCNM